MLKFFILSLLVGYAYSQACPYPFTNNYQGTVIFLRKKYKNKAFKKLNIFELNA
jgi:hypothetical protein